jgi:hypothetical protein
MHSGIHIETINEKNDRRYDQPVINEYIFPIANAPLPNPGNDDQKNRQYSNPQQTENGYNQNFIVHKKFLFSHNSRGSSEPPHFPKADCTSEGGPGESRNPLFPDR